MSESYFKFGLIAILLSISVGAAHAEADDYYEDHEPIEPFDLFIEPTENHEHAHEPDAQSETVDPLFLPDTPTILDRESNQTLPKLSNNREERLTTLFETLRNAPNNVLAQKAEQEIKRTWDCSGSDTIDLLLAWADEAKDKEQHGKALDFLDNVIRLRPDFAEGWNRRATIYFIQRNYSQSIADVERTLQLEPRHFAALSGLGRMLQEMGREKEALEAFQKALEINPSMSHLKEVVVELEKKVKGRAI